MWTLAGVSRTFCKLKVFGLFIGATASPSFQTFVMETYLFMFATCHLSYPAATVIGETASRRDGFRSSVFSDLVMSLHMDKKTNVLQKRQLVDVYKAWWQVSGRPRGLWRGEQHGSQSDNAFLVSALNCDLRPNIITSSRLPKAPQLTANLCPANLVNKSCF